MGNTMFMMAQFTPDGIQILTCGTDRKIAYWETLDCSLVREVEGSSVATLNCMDISPDGRCFVTGSGDSIVKIWEYDSADSTHVGTSHAAAISACKFSPDGEHVVTASADGEIIIWKYSFEILEDSKSTAQTERTASSTHRSHNGDSDKVSLRKAEGGGDVAADETARSTKKSTSSCASKSIF